MPSTSAAPDRAWIVAQRPPRRAKLDPFRPHAWFLESERAASGQLVSSGAIFLTNKECPWRCLMCDLWQHTLTETVPLGAIPQQIDFALAQWGVHPEQLKLYNSGSFFDVAAIPPADYAAMARRVAFAKQVVVESHPRLVGERTLRWRDLLSGALEVAMGLETVHPQVLARLGKQSGLADFARAADFLQRGGMTIRAFVLVKPPFMSEAEGLEWAVKSAQYAFAQGVGVVSFIPTRGGNGALDQLQAAQDFSPPALATLEQAQLAALDLRGGRVFMDTWDLARFSRCPACFAARRDRFGTINHTQLPLPAIQCVHCHGL